MARYLITGGAGFIGSSIAERLVTRGDSVIVFDDFSTGRRENIESVRKCPEFTLVEGDVRDPAAVREVARRCDFILHLAALTSVQRSMKEPREFCEVNIGGTLNVLLAADAYSRIRRVVFASSSSVYGDSPTLPKTESMQNNPLSPYAVSKIAGEDYCRMFSSSYRVDTLCLRYFNVFGPRQSMSSSYAAVIPRFISAIGKGKEPVIYGDGKQSRDFTYVDNVVDANILATQTTKASGEIVNIACNSRVTIEGLARFIGTLFGREVNPRFEKARSGDVRHSLADITKAKELLGYHPRVGVEEGLRLTVEWSRPRLR